MSGKHETVLLAQVWLSLCLLVSLNVPSHGYFMSTKKSQEKLQETQANDFGARTMFFVVARNSDHLNLPHSQSQSFWQRVRRDLLRAEEPREPKILRMEINGQITARFAETKVESVLENSEGEDLEVVFTVQLPDTAFISNFTMLIDGVFYEAKVAEKHEAEKEYEEAKRENKTAGHVSSSAPRDPLMKERGMEIFNVAINVKAKSTAEFTLAYQQLLIRDLGIYEYIVSVRPRQIVDDLSLNIKIYEPQGLRYVDIYEPGQNSVSQSIAVKRKVSEKMMEVSYIPDRAHQEAIMAKQSSKYNGMDGDFILRYDVEHGNKDAGHVVEDGGFFVHYFAPSGLEPQPKNIIFVIDKSGSMAGEKMDQTRQAMMYILDFLRPSDTFQMIYFDSQLKFWSGERLMDALPELVEDAKKHVSDHLKSGSSTDINSALLAACRILNNQGVKGKSYIVFLTDGNPTNGVINYDHIVSNVKEVAAGYINVFSLGFGFDMNFQLLHNISANTNGTVRRIYPGSDAAEQITNFIQGINTPLIYDVQLQYDSNAIVVESLTRSSYPQYFNGSELIVAGKLKDNPPASWTVNVVGVTGENDPLTFQTNISSIQEDLEEIEKEGVIVKGFAERLWAYLTIKDLLLQRRTAESFTQEQLLYQEALKLALQYKLVTPVTSLLIKEANQQVGSKTRLPVVAYDMANVYPITYQASGGAAANISAHVFTLISCILSYIKFT